MQGAQQLISVPIVQKAQRLSVYEKPNEYQSFYIIVFWRASHIIFRGPF